MRHALLSFIYTVFLETSFSKSLRKLEYDKREITVCIRLRNIIYVYKHMYMHIQPRLDP